MNNNNNNCNGDVAHEDKDMSTEDQTPPEDPEIIENNTKPEGDNTAVQDPAEIYNDVIPENNMMSNKEDNMTSNVTEQSVLTDKMENEANKEPNEPSEKETDELESQEQVGETF